MSVSTKIWLGFTILATVMGLVLFLPADTLDFWQAWAFMSVYFGSSLLIAIYLMRRDPALLKRRLRGGPTAEKQHTQKVIMLIASIGFIAQLVIPALDHRLGWSSMPAWVMIIGDALSALSFYFIFLVYKENTFASAVIEVVENQRVISTGPYASVRHPMYFGGSLLFIGTPLALGSWYGFLGFIAMFPALIWRLLNEEKFLRANLPGYTEYCAKVRWRLIPGVF